MIYPISWRETLQTLETSQHFQMSKTQEYGRYPKEHVNWHAQGTVMNLFFSLLSGLVPAAYAGNKSFSTVEKNGFVRVRYTIDVSQRRYSIFDCLSVTSAGTYVCNELMSAFGMPLPSQRRDPSMRDEIWEASLRCTTSTEIRGVPSITISGEQTNTAIQCNAVPCVAQMLFSGKRVVVESYVTPDQPNTCRASSSTLSMGEQLEQLARKKYSSR